MTDSKSRDDSNATNEPGNAETKIKKKFVVGDDDDSEATPEQPMSRPMHSESNPRGSTKQRTSSPPSPSSTVSSVSYSEHLSRRSQPTLPARTLDSAMSVDGFEVSQLEHVNGSLAEGERKKSEAQDDTKQQQQQQQNQLGGTQQAEGQEQSTEEKSLQRAAKEQQDAHAGKEPAHRTLVGIAKRPNITRQSSEPVPQAYQAWNISRTNANRKPTKSHRHPIRPDPAHQRNTASSTTNSGGPAADTQGSDPTSHNAGDTATPANSHQQAQNLVSTPSQEDFKREPSRTPSPSRVPDAQSGMSRTQQKLLLQRQHVLAEDPNHLAHPRNQRLLTKEMERLNREYACLRRFEDPLLESLQRCFARKQQPNVSHQVSSRTL
ncbi:uncharacterized protein VTP21DRAFT_8543 [Calcarisporiella thermophila]|uniref:uncharacterized protein n=1 Tax=Calcarisporiella thermophila TaxID=911321 RepID=UPI0037424A2A